MRTTVTSVVGYGVKVDPELFVQATGYPHNGWEDALLDEETYPLLKVVREGTSPNEEHWIMLAKYMTHVYSGFSGDGNHAELKGPQDSPIPLHSLNQLAMWQIKFGHEACIPSWNLVQFIN